MGIAIVIAGVIFFLFYPELILFYFVAIGMGAAYATALYRYYDKHSYYQKKGFWVEKFQFAACFAVIAIPISIVFLAHGWSNFLGGLTSLPVMVIILVAYYVSTTRRAAAEDKAINEALAKLLEATEKYSEYAYIVSYYSENGDIYARVVMDDDPDEVRIERVCCGYASSVERFASYAEANHVVQVSRTKNREDWVTCKFPPK